MTNRFEHPSVAFEEAENTGSNTSANPTTATSSPPASAGYMPKGALAVAAISATASPLAIAAADRARGFPAGRAALAPSRGSEPGLRLRHDVAEGDHVQTS